jgi:uncharacterized membrane protein YhaH (DUF805 family)
MTFQRAIVAGFTRYFDFRGRASRSEFWYWVLFTILAGLVAGIVDAALGFDSEPATTMFGLATIIPNFLIMVRRLHDIDASGWWLLLGLIPLVGVVVLIVWFCFRSTPGYNRFGPNPFGDMGRSEGPPNTSDRAREEEWRRRAVH